MENLNYRQLVTLGKIIHQLRSKLKKKDKIINKLGNQIKQLNSKLKQLSDEIDELSESEL